MAEAKVSIFSRLPLKVNAQLEETSREYGISKSDYVRLSVLEQLRQDGVKPELTDDRVPA